MNNRLNNIFSETDCLSAEILIAYAENRLEADERYLVEKHLLDCAFCVDALEGISTLKDKSKLKPALVDISKRIDTYSHGRKPKVIHFDFRMRMAVAAVLIVIVGFTFLFRNILMDQNKEMVAQRTVKESKLDETDKRAIDKTKEAGSYESNRPDSYKSDVPEQKVKQQDGETGESELQADLELIPYVVGSKNQEEASIAETQQSFASFYRSGEDANSISTTTNTPISTATGGVVTKDAENDQDVSKKEDVALDKSIVAEKSEVQTENEGLYETPTLTSTSTDNKSNAPYKSTKEENQMKEKSVAVTVAASGKSQTISDELANKRYSDGVQLYQNTDYSGCISQMQSYLGDAPDDISAYYYCGVSQYFLGQYDSAITSLSKVMKDKKSSFYETAQWYLSLSYIGKSDVDEAEKTLNDIVKAKGSFKSQAEEKLIEIENK